LTTLLEHAAVDSVVPTPNTPDVPAAPKKRGWLPLLTVLFLISYGLMTMLIVEQGATIESQRALLRELYRDSQELSALRTRALQEKNRGRRPKPRPIGQSAGSSDPDAVDSDPVHPDSFDPDPVNPDSVNPDSVKPGSSNHHPVFPGGTATPYPDQDRKAEAPVPDAYQTGIGSGR
jgi:hypothetical protein